MVRFSLRFFVFTGLLIFGIFVGIHIAENGIFKVAGAPMNNVKSFQVSKNKDQVEVMVLGQTYKKSISNNSPKESVEKKKLPSDSSKEQNNPSSGFLSKVGNAVGSTLQSGTEKGFEMISNLLN